MVSFLFFLRRILLIISVEAAKICIVPDRRRIISTFKFNLYYVGEDLGRNYLASSVYAPALASAILTTFKAVTSSNFYNFFNEMAAAVYFK